MVTKEQLLFDKIMEQFRYSLYGRRNDELKKLVISIFNGLGYGFKIYPAIDYYDSDEINDDLVMIGKWGEPEGLDPYEFANMIKPEDMEKFLTPEVIKALSDIDITDTFDEYVEKNFPDAYEKIDTSELDDIGYRSGIDVFEADWNHLIELLQGNFEIGPQNQGIRPISEAKLGRIKRDIIKTAIERDGKRKLL